MDVDHPRGPATMKLSTRRSLSASILLGISTFATACVADRTAAIVDDPLGEQNQASCFPSCARGSAEIAVGDYHSCARSFAGLVQCWGANGFGALGDGTAIARIAPAPTSYFGRVMQISAGSEFTCARVSDGSVWCWGRNNYEQIGIPCSVNGGSCAVPSIFGTDAAFDPTRVPSISNATSVSSGTLHSCALLADQTMKCWGGNQYGELGFGYASALGHGPDAAPSTGGMKATKVAAGRYATCALDLNGAAWCWGRKFWSPTFNSGVAANPPADEIATTPVMLAAGPFTQISVGDSYACGLRAGGITCWGYNWGEFSSVPQGVFPVTDFGLPTVRSVAVGTRSHCAVTGTGVSCAGWGSFGTLGNGLYATSDAAVSVINLAGPAYSIASAADSYGSCALTGSAYAGAGLTAQCWGNNNGGQLGVSTAALPKSATPVTIPIAW